MPTVNLIAAAIRATPPAAWLNPNKPLHTDLTTKSDINHEGSTTPEKGRELARPPSLPWQSNPWERRMPRYAWWSGSA
jgi:hypothetical protein